MAANQTPNLLADLAPPWRLTGGGADHLLYAPKDGSGNFTVLLQNPYGETIRSYVDAGGERRQSVGFEVVLPPGSVVALESAVATDRPYWVQVSMVDSPKDRRRLMPAEPPVTDLRGSARASLLSLPFGALTVSRIGGESIYAKTWELDAPRYAPPGRPTTFTVLHQPGAEVPTAIGRRPEAPVVQTRHHVPLRSRVLLAVAVLAVGLGIDFLIWEQNPGLGTAFAVIGIGAAIWVLYDPSYIWRLLPESLGYRATVEEEGPILAGPMVGITEGDFLLTREMAEERSRKRQGGRG